MGDNPITTEKLNLRRPLHRRIARQAKVRFRETSKAPSPRLIERSSLDKAKVRLTLQVINAQLQDLIWVFDSEVQGEADTACGVHVDNCPVVTSPCASHWFGDCTTQVNCESEACASAFACAGTHNCDENACSDVTCHPDTFGCTDHVVPCTAEAPPTCATEAPTCPAEQPGCLLEEPTDPCVSETCFVDEPSTPCEGEDEGSDCFVHADDTEGSEALRTLFRSPIWTEIVLRIAATNPRLDTKIRNTRFTFDQDLFRHD
jgi:hypothetical protein